MSRFVKPSVVRLQISHDDYIDVKGRLNTGETQELFARMVPVMHDGEVNNFKSVEVLRAKVLMYLLSWSLTDDGKPVPMSPDLPEDVRLATLNNLDPATFREIRDAIAAHEAKVEKEIHDSKNVQGGESEPS